MINYKEFLFVLSPGDEISNDIFNYKLRSKHIVGEFYSMYSQAHLTVRHIPIRNRRDMIGLLGRLERVLHYYMPPIALQTDGFGLFKDNGVIYTKIKEDPYTSRWFELLRERIVAEGKITPHITIARKLSPEAVAQLWPHFQHRDYLKSFYVDHLTVLERNIIDGSYRPIRKLYFGSKDVVLSNVLTLFDPAVTTPLQVVKPLPSPIIFS